jgi:hypothetical protein
MRRLLFAIGLIVVAVVALSTFGSPDRPEPTPTPAPFAFDFPTRIPAPTATPGPAQPTNIAVDELRTAFEQTSALTSLRGELVTDTTIQAQAEPEMSGVVKNAARITITEGGSQQSTDVSNDMGGKLISHQLSDMIILGTTGYISNTVINGEAAEQAALPTPEVMGVWQIMPSEQVKFMSSMNTWSMWLMQMIDLDHDLPLLVLQGQESVGGIACDRYFTDKASMGPAAIFPGTESAQKELIIWHCVDGNLRRIEVHINMSQQQDASISIGTTMRMELIEAPTTVVITAPANAVPMKR